MCSNPIPVKKALELSGFPVGGLRPPLVEATPAETEALRQLLQD
jgi:4-hydroxy-tetrahydrodipicolinate synthase